MTDKELNPYIIKMTGTNGNQENTLSFYIGEHKINKARQSIIKFMNK